MTIQTHHCPRCGAEFETIEALERHLFRTHTGEVETRCYRCATCDAEFVARADWYAHVREGH